MIRFEAFASSSAGCCYRLSQEGETPLLIEAGLPFKRLQQALEFQVSALCGCLVSHAHGDHIQAAADLMKHGIDCYASTQTWCAYPKCEPYGHRAKIVRDLEVFKVGPWSVMPFEVPHDQAGTFGYIVSAPSDETLVYLTDAAYSPVKFHRPTILAIECNWSEELMKENVLAGAVDRGRFQRTVATHMSVERVEKMLAANDLTNTREIHLLHLSSANSDADAFRERIQKQTGVPVFIAA